MPVLITGGAGYIGSFVARAVIERGHDVVIVDDLSKGHRSAVPEKVPLLEIECGDTERVAEAMREHKIDAVIHLAALSLVGESVENPGLYWRRNVGQAIGLLEACHSAGVRNFVLSSTAAVYGEPEKTPIDEDQPLAPTNPYGATKVAIEQMLHDFQVAHALGWVALRYFNAAGAAPDGSLGEDHTPESHLIPLALQARLGQRPPLTIFGTDYPTPDGTCLRDYIHVLDLADAHARALDWLEAHPGQRLIANLGASQASSVREILDAVAKVTGKEVPHTTGARRPGDPAILVASNGHARQQLGWVPKHSDIETIVGDAWAWHGCSPST